MKEQKKVLDPITMVTVRLPRSMREQLKLKAIEQKTSLNKLCITKLFDWLFSGRCIHCGNQIHKQVKDGPWIDNSGGDVCGVDGNEAHIDILDKKVNYK